MALIEFGLLVAVLLFILYKWLTLNNNFFKERGIAYEKPYLFLGSFTGSIFGSESFFDSIKTQYMKYTDKQIYGLFQGRIPLIAIKDTELIKQVTVKDFDHFVNHLAFAEPEDDILFGNSLFVLKDQKWKDMRSTLSPAFTGSKMRLMFRLVTECCDQANEVLSKHQKENPKGFDLDLKDFITRYTNDVIASSAFGIKINSISGENSEFYDVGKKVTTFDTIASLKFMLLANFKTLMRFFKIKLFDPKLTQYFVGLVTDTMKHRAKHNIHRPDMVDMLMEAQKTSTRQWTDVEIVAQCFLFFFAGFETTALLMCFACFELMQNPESLEKLYEEIQEVKENLNGEPLTYEALQGMKYIDMVLSETLRKWPAALAIDRICTKPYTLKTDEVTVDIKVGESIWIPVTGLHYDPENFPNPNQFDPERFSDENKHNIKPFSYCPFGLGPRVCIGSRLALMESKAILFNIIADFDLKPSEKTKIPIELDTKGFQIKPKGGFWIKFIPRK